MKAIITGATGYVGEGILLAMLDDNRIEEVLSISRRPCGHSHPKLKELITPDLLNLSSDDTRLQGYDVMFFAAGITSVGTPTDVYDVISYDIPMHIADILPSKENMTFIYVSGAGTTDKGRQHWQQIKSKVEHQITTKGYKHAFGWRPTLMAPYKGQKNRQVKAQKATLIMYPILRPLGLFTTMKEMCNAVIKVTQNGFSKDAVSSADIIKLGRKK